MAPTKTDLCNMMVKAWDNISEEVIRTSFHVCGQVKDVNIDEIVSFQDGRVAADGREKLSELFELNPKDIDYETLTRLHEETVIAEVMDEQPNELSEEEQANQLYQATLELEFNGYNNLNLNLIDDPLGDYYVIYVVHAIPQ